MKLDFGFPIFAAGLLALLAAVVPAAGDSVAADFHTITLKADGTLAAAGPNAFGQLGMGDTWPRELFCPVPAASGFDRIWSAVGATIARKPDGSLWGCGDLYSKRLGTGGGAVFSELASLGGGWADIGVGGNFTLGVKSDGSLWSWGNASNGELGSATVYGYREVPGRIGTASDWQSVAAGDYHCLAIKTDGSLWAWGSNSDQQLGDGATNGNPRSTPFKVGTFSDWKSVSAGAAHSMGIRADGSLWTWGANSSGQLGDGTNVKKGVPTRIGSGTDWAAVISGGTHSLALKTDGSLWTWGGNGSGQLGLGDTTNRNAPVRVGTGNDWSAIDAGPLNSAGVRDGAVWLWGANSNFQLGETTPAYRTAPAVATYPLRPEITVTWSFYSPYIAIGNGQYTGDFGVTAQGDPVTRTATVRNTGSAALTVGEIAAAPGFSVQAAVPVSLAPGESLMFLTSLDATNSGDFSGNLTISSNDADESAFVIHLTGKVLSFDTDGDGDGLSDAAELKLAEFGFRWNAADSSRVAAFQDGAARAGLINAKAPDRPLIPRAANGRAAIAIGLQRSGGLSEFSDVEMTGWEIDPAGRLVVPQPMEPGRSFFRFSLEPLPANP